MTAASKSGKQQPAKARRRRVTKVSRATSSLVSKAIRAKGFAEAEVVTRWGRIVGEDLARATVPIKLQFPRGQRADATLHIRTVSAFAPLLQQRAPHVIELVNRFLGYAAVARIEVKQGPLPDITVSKELEKRPLDPRQSERLTDIVGDGDLSPLRAAVKSLGEHVLSNEKKKG